MPDTVIGAKNRAGNKTKSRPPWSSHPRLTGISTTNGMLEAHLIIRQRWVGGVDL